MSELSKRVALIAGLAACTCMATAGEVRLDTLMVSGAASPCLAIRVNIIRDNTSLSELNLGPTGTVKVQKGAVVHFEKGRSYLLQATCISGSSFTQSTGLTFTADGRTVIVQFAENGFQIRRGGVAY